jgi:hypothetical protein
MLAQTKKIRNIRFFITQSSQEQGCYRFRFYLSTDIVIGWKKSCSSPYGNSSDTNNTNFGGIIMKTLHLSRLAALAAVTVLNTFFHLSVLGQVPVGAATSTARTSAGDYISWREHIIDDSRIAGFSLSGSDGLVMGDIDGDGFADIVSVHESDSEYDSSVFDPNYQPSLEGHVRIAFASASPDQWLNITLAEGVDAPAPEDVAVADINNDGHLDVVVAAELSHLIYLQNPGGVNSRTKPWPKLILPMTKNAGSYIRVFTADLDGDGNTEILAANKGAQRPGPDDYAQSTPVSLFHFTGAPLDPNSWHEIVLGSYSIPQNAEPIDLDGDGDLDIVIGSRGENRIAFFENRSTEGNFSFIEHAIGINGPPMSGFNFAYADLSGDGRLDIISRAGQAIAWIEQPANIDHAWNSHPIGTFLPDTITGIELGDINADGLVDVLVGSYSEGSRLSDAAELNSHDALGRLGWFANPGSKSEPWIRHDISRRKRGMFDKFIARDMDLDGDIDFVGTRGNSAPFDGVFWLEQLRTKKVQKSFFGARLDDSEEMPLP